MGIFQQNIFDSHQQPARSHQLKQKKAFADS
jgi:hypothetical protein